MKKSLFSQLLSGNSAMSPVIGIILMLLLTILLAGITVTAVYGDGLSTSLGKAPLAAIEVENIEGGVPNKVKYKENYIILLHKGGESLRAGDTKIIITGEGSAYTGVFGAGGTTRFGDVSIRYDDLTATGKNSPYASRNPDILDAVWSAGEELVLNGDDSAVGTAPSSVRVTINGMTNTSDNYGLREGGTVTIKVFDRRTDKIIAECEHFVLPAE